MNAVLDHLDELEIGLCLRINRLGQIRQVRVFFALVSHAGDGGFWAAMCLAMIAIHGAESLPAVAQMLLTGTVGLLVYKLLKGQLIRERPFISNGAIRCGTAPLDRYSFPSGHTLHAVSFTIVLAHAEPALLVLALPFAILVAISRVVLGLHYPSDVVAGAALGAALGSAAVMLA
jgi:undecaprenyl-diphosphatase